MTNTDGFFFYSSHSSSAIDVHIFMPWHFLITVYSAMRFSDALVFDLYTFPECTKYKFNQFKIKICSVYFCYYICWVYIIRTSAYWGFWLFMNNASHLAAVQCSAENHADTHTQATRAWVNIQKTRHQNGKPHGLVWVC